MMIRKIILALLLALIFCGCIQTNKDDIRKLVSFSNEGIKILEFSFPKLKDNLLPEGSSVTLILRIQNVGEANASNIEVTLYSLGAFDLQSLNSTKGSCNVNSASCTIPLLDRPNPAYQIPGEEATITWDLKAKKIGVSGVFPQEVKVRVSYDYYTYAYQEFLALSKQRLEFYQVHKEKMPALHSRLSQAPIEIDISMPSMTLAGSEIPLVVTFTNVGKGFLMPKEDCDYPGGCISNIAIEVEGSGVNIKNCTSYAKNPSNNGRKFTAKDVPIISPVACTLNISSGIMEDTLKVEVSINYRYVLEDSAEINVAGMSL